jgi:hypothetical protein
LVAHLRAAVALATTTNDHGYGISTADSGVYPFANAAFKGSAHHRGVGRSVVGIW